MKLPKINYWFGLILFVIMFVSCMKYNELSEIPSRDVQTTILANDTTPTQISISTSVPTHTSKLISTLTPIPTRTKTLSPNSSAVSTLSVEDARKSLSEILSNNGNCRLPCLWGIIPGKSTSTDVRNRLMPISSISTFTKFRPGLDTITPNYNEGELTIALFLGVITDMSNYTVQRISFSASALKKTDSGSEYVFDSKVFGQQYGLYLLPQILIEYGRPTSVLIFTLAEIPNSNRGPERFNILLLYPDQGILVHYASEMQIVGKNVVGCPVKSYVDMELFPSGNRDSFFENLAQTKWSEEYIKNNYKPLEEVTSMSIEEFYQTFRQPTDTCLTTPANLWPVPER